MVAASSSKMRSDGSPACDGFQLGDGRMGSNARLSAMRAMCSDGLALRLERRAWNDARRSNLPASAAWKNSRQVLHTAADPPNQGRMILPIIGCTANSRNALRKIVQA